MKEWFIYFDIRYLDKNSSALLMLKASARWLSVCGNTLVNFLFLAVPVGALLVTQSPGIRNFYGPCELK